jgi:hypothetical protein
MKYAAFVWSVIPLPYPLSQTQVPEEGRQTKYVKAVGNPLTRAVSFERKICFDERLVHPSRAPALNVTLLASMVI